MNNNNPNPNFLKSNYYPNYFNNNNNFESKNNNIFNMINNNSNLIQQNNQSDYINNLNNLNNFNKFSNPKNHFFKNQNKGNKGLSDFANNQKRDLTDIKHLEELILKVIQLRENNDNIQDEAKELIINKIKLEILSLAKDVAGNYAIQKILNNQKPYEVNFIIESLKNKIYELTLNLYGCRVVQELISILDNKNISIVTSELKPFYEKCIEDKNGNHVIQKLIEKLSEQDLSDIYLVSLNNIINLSRHQYGCRVIQRLFKYCNKEQIHNMLFALFKDINELIKDQYGNYVIQFILENQSINNDDLFPIYEGLKGNVYNYSFHKFASNVVERCLTFGNEKQIKDIANEIIELDKNDPEYIINMVKDKFANYVIQKMIEHSDSTTQQKLIKIILSKQNRIKNEGFSKHVLNYIEKINGNNKSNKYKMGNINMDNKNNYYPNENKSFK
jgi:predicted metallopeptidase